MPPDGTPSPFLTRRLRVARGRTELAHRYAWTTRHGPIPKGALLCHRCDERRCVNPDHLLLGDWRLSMADLKAKRLRRATMSKPIRQRAATADEAQKELVRRVAFQAELRTLRRVRDYLARGRPLGSLPPMAPRSQWIDACLALCIHDDDSRAQEFEDLDPGALERFNDELDALATG